MLSVLLFSVPDFLNESAVDASRSLLHEYVEVRSVPQTDLALIDSSLARSEEIHAQLWTIVEDSVQSGDESAITALCTEAINEVIDVHTLRTTAGERRLPNGLIMVFVIAAGKHPDTYSLSFGM